MFIHLDSSAISAVIDGPDAGRSFACIQDLLRAHHKGHHFLSLDPGDTERLALSTAWARLSGDHRECLERIRATALEIESIRNALSHHLVLGVGDGFDGRAIERSDGSTVLQASLLRFEGVAAERAVLLCENMTDADFYRAVAEILRAYRKSEIALCHDPRGGSGSQIDVAAVHVADEGKILLAIADSDQSSATSARGPTGANLERVMRGRPSYQHAHVLPAREAENLVPLGAYKRVLEDLGGRAPQLSVLSVLQRALQTREEIHHADFKDGITLHQITQKMKGKPEHATWFAVAARRGVARCQRRQGECERPEECECYVVDKLGGRILHDVVEWLRREGMRSPRKTRELFGLSEGSALKEIAEKVIAWGCAYPPQLGA